MPADAHHAPAPPAPLWMRTRRKARRIIEAAITSARLAYHVTGADIRGGDRIKEIAWARHVTFWLLARPGQMSQSAVARAFGKDHGTVRNGCHNVENARSLYPEVRAQTDRLAEELLQAQ